MLFRSPNDLLQNADPIALLALIPVFDFIIYPALRKRGYGRFLRPIVRIWAGFMCGALAMAYTAVLQYWIYRTNPCGEYVSSCATPSSISVWVQVPSYVRMINILRHEHRFNIREGSRCSFRDIHVYHRPGICL